MLIAEQGNKIQMELFRVGQITRTSVKRAGSGVV